MYIYIYIYIYTHTYTYIGHLAVAGDRQALVQVGARAHDGAADRLPVQDEREDVLGQEKSGEKS